MKRHTEDGSNSDNGAGVGVGVGNANVRSGAPHRTAKDLADIVGRYADKIEQSHAALGKDKLPATEEDNLVRDAREAAKAAATRQGSVVDNRRVASNITITSTLTRGFTDGIPLNKIAEMERHDTYTKMRTAWTAYNRIPPNKRTPVVPAVLLADWANLGRFGPYNKHVIKEDGTGNVLNLSGRNNNNNNNNNNDDSNSKRTFMFVEVVNTRVTESEGCYAVFAFRFTPDNVCALKPKYVQREPEFYREAWLINCYAVYGHMPITIEDDKSNLQ